MWPLILKPVLIVLILAVGALGPGRWILQRLSDGFSRFDKVVLGWLGGMGILSPTFFLAGQWCRDHRRVAVLFAELDTSWITDLSTTAAALAVF
jgi:hypothetical protein